LSFSPFSYIWTHQLLVVIPSNLNKEYTDSGALWITGGGNGDGMPSAYDEDVLVCASLATNSGTPCGVLYQVPNQDIIFATDPGHPRGEDWAVAWTWRQFMANHQNQPDWLLEFPMVRAASKALTVMQNFVEQKLGPDHTLKRFMAFGASKRGWTTWLLGAVDDRLMGIAPVVMDLLNFSDGIAHMFMTLGNFSFALEPYLDSGVPQYFGTPAVEVMAKYIDPLQYKENLSLPKLVIDATGDEFFQVQDDQFWWGKLPGETLRMMIDNAEHSMATGALYLITGVEAWYWGLLKNEPRPNFSWTINPDPNNGAITIKVADGTPQPTRVVMRFTTTLDGYRRDFRLVSGDTPANPCKYIPVPLFGKACLRPQIWIGEDVAETAPGVYVISQPMPPWGWRGFLAELYFDGPQGTNTTYQLTTQVSVIPNTYPFPACTGQACQNAGLV
jgi:PhoPQ-activated pathogenicity-related protein